MTHALYLAAILGSLAGISLLDRRLHTGIASPRLVRTVAVTVGTFLVFDLVGSARGWFASNPSLNVHIFPPGIPLEEPVLLTLLTVTSVALWCGLRRVTP
jgi:lycopene cyclase domain-containing protein